MRVGIWCAYGKTLAATDGIGVFAHMLARHLAGHARVDGVELLVHRGDAAVVADTVCAGAGRIGVVELEPLGVLDRWKRKRLRWRHRRLSEQIGRDLRGSIETHRLEERIKRIERATAQLLAKQKASRPHALEDPSKGGCDVWVLPHVSVERRFSAATVVLIHDMVPLRVAGLVKPHDLASFRRRSQAVAEQSTLIGCMSKVIRDADIVGLLGSPEGKIRVVRPAVPDDLGLASGGDPSGGDDSSAVLPADVRQPYLLYPAAFRPYKNHELLIDALQELDRRGFPTMNLVFTGESTLPKHLAERATACGVADRVCTLGRVARGMLKSLYRNAAATVIPSRHEQGSFPALEALACGCPVAVSDIPSLREAFGPLGEAVPFFDPTSPAALVEAVAGILQDPAAVRGAQASGFEQLRRRSWAEATDEWIDVFAEAIERDRARPG